MMKRISFVVKGVVQGVGYRYFVREQAKRLNLSGWVANYSDGSVRGEAQGAVEKIDEFIRELKEGCDSAVVEEVNFTELPCQETDDGFEIRYL